MKKILFFLLIGGALFMASCTKNYAVIPNQTSYATLAPTDWSTADTSKTYTTTISEGSDANFGGSSDGILIYFSFDGGKTYEQIPETYNNVAFSYTVTKGQIVLYAQSATGATTIAAPVALTAKIVLVPSN